jgi:hypothetical protein
LVPHRLPQAAALQCGTVAAAAANNPSDVVRKTISLFISASFCVACFEAAMFCVLTQLLCRSQIFRISVFEGGVKCDVRFLKLRSHAVQNFVWLLMRRNDNVPMLDAE